MSDQGTQGSQATPVSATTGTAPVPTESAYAVRRVPALPVTPMSVSSSPTHDETARALRSVSEQLRALRDACELVDVPLVAGTPIRVGGWETPPQAIMVGGVRSASGAYLTLTAAPGVSWSWDNGVIVVSMLGLTAGVAYIVTLVAWR